MLKDKDRIFQNLYNDQGQMLLHLKKEETGSIQRFSRQRKRLDN